jgi:hypothetical protein
MDIQDIEIELEDMAYSNYRGNEYYRAVLPNGDILTLSKYGYYGDDRKWTWQVSLPQEEIFHYAAGYRGHDADTAEECLDDFYVTFQPRNWVSKYEREPVYYRCLECGWEGSGLELLHMTVIENYGDVDCLKCPGCQAIEYDGLTLFEQI